MGRGVFITFEGLDGAGKSTQIERLCTALRRIGCEVLTTREPGGSMIGDEIRTLLLKDHNPQMAPLAEALLYAASRAQLVGEVIAPALARGVIVLCDRYIDASIAYQGEGLGLGRDAVQAVNRFATQGLTPELTILFDLDVQTSKARVHQALRSQGPDRIEQRDMDYFKRVRECFLDIARQEPHRVATVDATQLPDELEQEIWDLVAKYVVI